MTAKQTSGDSGSPKSRIWTTSLHLEAENFTFPDELYAALEKDKRYDQFGDTGRDRLLYGLLGAHYVEGADGVQVLMLDPKLYVEFVTSMIRRDDPKAVVYGIYHDKDVKQERGSIVPKVSHLHILARYSKPVRLNGVASAMGVLPSLVEKGKTKGRYAFDSALAYLVHALSPEKHQYDPQEVINGADDEEQFVDIYNEKADTWKKRAADVKAEKQQLNFEAIRQAVMLGEYTRDDLIGAEDEDLYMLYVRNKRDFDDARAAYLERRFIEYNRMIDRGEIKIQSLFVTGPAGSGKTRLAKAIAEGVCKLSGNDKNKQWHIFQAAPSNPFDDYDGQEIILLDDVRATSLQSASDWLKLMDPHNNSKTSARYRNASPMPRLIIITATETPHEFFSYVKSASENEPLDQFLRRIQWTARVVDVSTVSVGEVLKLDAPTTQTLIPATVMSEHRGKNASKTVKPGREKSFQYVYGDRATGSFDDVAQTMIRLYADYYGFADASKVADPLQLSGDTNEPTSMFPIRHNGDEQNLNGFGKTSK